MRVDVTIEGSLREIFKAESAAIAEGAIQAVRKQTIETKASARSIVSAALGRRGSRHSR